MMTMSNNTSEFRYIAYVRKSDPRKERQVLSHSAQTRRIKEQFPDLNIVYWLEAESASAFKPGRPVFDKAIKLIRQGKADGIVTYSTNRLSRNEIDAAEVTYMLRTGIMKDVKFCTYTFENNPEGIMMLQVLLSQSQYESSKHGKDVKRGMVEKAMGGERPGSVPNGYQKVPVKDEYGNIKTNKEGKIITYTAADPLRYDLVKKMWEMLLTGLYTPRQIRKIANEEWHYLTPATPNKPSRPLPLSVLYRLFNNVFYTGHIKHEGEVYKANHPQMITLEEYDRAQLILGERGKPRTGVNAYAYTSLMKCGECGCSILAKTRIKHVKSTGKALIYIYYYCGRKSEARPCTQTKYTRLEVLESEIDAELAKYTILPEFRALALEIINKKHKVEVKERNQVQKMQQTKQKVIQEQLDNLVDMRTRNLLDDDEYLRKKSELKGQMLRANEDLISTQERAEDWLELTEKAFNFATYARVHFKNGSLETKRSILTTLGQNLLLKDNKLTLTPNEWLVPIGNGYPALEKAYLTNVTTNKKAHSHLKEEAFSQINDTWRAIRDSNPEPIA